MSHEQVLLQAIAAAFGWLLPLLPIKLFLCVDLSCIVMPWAWQLVIVVLKPLNPRLEIKWLWFAITQDYFAILLYK
jgi:hypothetical protein